MMLRETNKIDTDDIRGSDIPTEYIFGAAFLVIAIAGGFLFKQLSGSERSLPLASKNRLD